MFLRVCCVFVGVFFGLLSTARSQTLAPDKSATLAYLQLVSDIYAHEASQVLNGTSTIADDAEQFGLHFVATWDRARLASAAKWLGNVDLRDASLPDLEKVAERMTSRLSTVCIREIDRFERACLATAALQTELAMSVVRRAQAQHQAQTKALSATDARAAKSMGKALAGLGDGTSMLKSAAAMNVQFQIGLRQR